MAPQDVFWGRVKMAPVTLAQLGAAAYIMWGVAHIAAAYSFYKAGLAMPFSVEQGRLLQNAWNIFFIAIAVIGIAIVLNRRNNKLGYWINVALASIADIGFIIFLILPRHVPLWPPIVVLILWILGVALTTAAYFRARA